MYLTIRRYEDNTALADLLTARGDEIRELISRVAGFHAYYLVKGTGGTASVTVCDDQAGVEESNQIAAGWLRENLPDAVSAPPHVNAGEVVLNF
jgi:hypothetical protein